MTRDDLPISYWFLIEAIEEGEQMKASEQLVDTAIEQEKKLRAETHKYIAGKLAGMEAAEARKILHEVVYVMIENKDFDRAATLMIDQLGDDDATFAAGKFD